jgi:uncharacterized membrane protein YcaP (DUF421 family)
VLVVALRLAAERAMSTLNAFDWVITVLVGSVGSVAASVAVSRSVPVVEGLLAISFFMTALANVTELDGSVRDRAADPTG